MPPRTTILTAALITALLHAYIGLRLLPAMPVPMLVKMLAVVWLALSCALLPAGLLARRFSQPWADRISWIGMLAMGFFSSLLVLTLARDVALAAAWLAGKLLGWQAAGLASGSALAVPLLALLVTLAGYINARRVARVVEVDVPVADLPEALHGFTIAQISDIHVGPTIKGPYLDRIVERVNSLQPDAVAITGDLVDGTVRELSAHTAPLARLQARHGSYFVTGNHEYYAGAQPWIDELRRLGLRVLMNEHVVVEHGGQPLVLAGVTDYSAGRFHESHRSDPHRAIAGAPAQAGVRVLLAHQPRTAAAAAEAGFDLQLSGHTHGGQFWPWNLFVPMQQPYTAGLVRHGAMWVYVSRGTGYWGPPKRFGAPSEITRLRLVRA
ncbi:MULTISPECIES: metallophosphoesterase [Cupriavidus]|uniref:Metallophosphoesterase n=1 Tax=Cupriavidus oxalaticus TaxID=96344 RepID=A0A4P7LIK9_9BURK|nr:MULTISPECIES: metallophosphoesterase [Cupriavidus]MBF6990917.1 metallophosphoesterase [Cupriavidus sp. IK-TO18]QBY54429.1 metallophosphoesterase [Cupriavidus oxalaticus]TDF66634.1 metallophosphoesterase [Cupriavidus sp. L7L]